MFILHLTVNKNYLILKSYYLKTYNHKREKEKMKKKKTNQNLPTASPSKEVSTIEMGDISPIVQLAMRGDIDVDKLDKLISVQARYEADMAKKEFYKSFCQFKNNSPAITKDNTVRYQNKDNTWTEYNHASLGKIIEIVSPLLAEQRLAVNWEQKQEGGQIHVTAVLSHWLGHSTSTTLSAPPDSSGGKNNVQAVASTTTYLQRYTVLPLLGLAAGEDDDGRGATPEGLDYIDADQVEAMQFEISKHPREDEEFTKTICDAYKVPSLQHILYKDYAEILDKISQSK